MPYAVFKVPFFCNGIYAVAGFILAGLQALLKRPGVPESGLLNTNSFALISVERKISAINDYWFFETNKT